MLEATPGWPGLPHDDEVEDAVLISKRFGLPLHQLRGVARASYVRLLAHLMNHPAALFYIDNEGTWSTGV